MDPKDFTSEDWYTVLEGTGAAAALITASDMSGPIGLTKEAMAAMEVLRESTWKTPFVAALRNEMFAATKEEQEALKKIAQDKQAALEGQKLTKEQALQKGLDSIRTAVQLVENKAGTEAAAEYRQLIYQMAQKTAAAGKEGGFLGIGGTPVSGAEQAMLDQIKTVLNL